MFNPDQAILTNGFNEKRHRPSTCDERIKSERVVRVENELPSTSKLANHVIDNSEILTSTQSQDSHHNHRQEVYEERLASSFVEDDEPLGYQHFLYDVNIEYSPGGSQSYSTGNKHCFKMKCLPYMVQRNDIQRDIRKNSVTSSNSSICDNLTIQDDDSILSSDPKYIDVTKATCAFLGNSDYVPNDKLGRRRVVLEIISAKLSQPTIFNVPLSTSSSSLTTVPEQPILRLNRAVTTPIRHSGSSITNGRDSNGSSQSLSSPSAPPVSSKRYVNYTILIKTAPGLDNHPAVIERRFSDFSQLYQGLKSNESYAKIVDRYITFPKKVYMGNFSLTNIAERSIEFSRLLSLCISNINLLWSNSFISFLLDKELKEAHKLSLCGDPDDVQALIETAYFIERKLFLIRGKSSPASRASSTSLETSNIAANGNCSSLPISKPVNFDASSIAETISVEGGNFSQPNRSTDNLGPSLNSSPSQSIWDTSEDLERFPRVKTTNLVSLDQRILVTFCMLFLTYYRGENYRELKVAVQEFNQLISNQDFVDSLVSSRHYVTLRACLLFLMNVNRGNVIDENQRLWLKRKLEDIDGAQAELDNSKGPSVNGENDTTLSSSVRTASKKRGSNSEISNGSTIVNRITSGDLTSLLRDRSFCSF